jgi:hypothetical protein
MRAMPKDSKSSLSQYQSPTMVCRQQLKCFFGSRCQHPASLGSAE